MNRVAEILAGVADLPPLPDTVLKLMGVLNDPDSTVAQIVDVIRYDQAVTAQVLRLCNSAYMGLAHPVHSLHEAMRFLGTARVLNLVITMHNAALLSGPQRGYDLRAGDLWHHSVAVALAAASFGRRMNLASQNLCFTAGLLHDIGKVVLSECVAREFAAILARVTAGRLSFTEAEKDALGCSHDEVGAELGARWRLPEPILRCIRWHHTPGALAPPDPLVEAVYLANCVCLLMGVGVGADELYCRADSGTMERHGLSTSDLELVGAQMLDELHSIEQMFGEASGASRERAAVRQEVCHVTRRLDR